VFFRTISSTLWHWTLATSTANTDTINDIALLGLVTKTASLVWARRTGSAVDDIQLSELYFALSANVQRVYSRGIDLSKDAHIEIHVHNIPISPQSKFESIVSVSDVVENSNYLTSQQRTRRRKRRTSDCFFFCNSSTYLRAPICELKGQLYLVAKSVEGTRRRKFTELAILSRPTCVGNCRLKIASPLISSSNALTDLDCGNGLSFWRFVVEILVVRSFFLEFQSVDGLISAKSKRMLSHVMLSR